MNLSNSFPTRHRFRSVIGAVVCAAALATSGCGIPLDSSPRAIDGPSIEPSSQQSDSAEGDATAALYFLRGDVVVPLIAELSNSGTDTVLTALLNGVPQPDAERGFVSQIPSGTSLLDSSVSNRKITITLSDEFDNVNGLAKVEAVAQLVITATSLAGIDSVSFRVGGSIQNVFSPLLSSDVDEVTACDYSASLPNEQEVQDLELDLGEQTELTSLQLSLSDCGE